MEGCGASLEPEGKLYSPYWQVQEGAVRRGKETLSDCKKQGGGYWCWLAVFMNGPIMSHQERGGHENTKGVKT